MQERNKVRSSTYFNLEMSPAKTTLVLNASKGGIDAFLSLYDNQKQPPTSLSFEQWQRPLRTWYSWDLQPSYRVLPTDPSPYMGARVINGLARNTIRPTLDIRWRETDSEEPLLAASWERSTKNPFLIVNQKGWQMFVDMVHCLRDRSSWFYVTQPSSPAWSHLPFLLTTPYPGDPDDPVFDAIECIRLEPEERIFLDIFTISSSQGPDGVSFYADVAGNSTGLLLFAQWLRDFSISPDTSFSVLNTWNDIFESVKYDEPRQGILPPPQQLHFMKTQTTSPHPVFSFGTGGEDCNILYISGNSQGLEELADVIEENAFISDHDRFGSGPSQRRLRGDISLEVSFPEGIQAVRGWQFYYGGLFNRSYSPRNEPKNAEVSFGEIVQTFVNERVYRGSNT